MQLAAQKKGIPIDWTIVNQGGKGTKAMIDLYKNPKWFEGFDVVIHNECFAETDDEEYIRGITKPHFEGVNAVVIHCAMHTYRSAKIDDWREFLGVTSRRHDHQSRYPVSVVKGDHPIMKGFPADYKSAMDELYIIEKVWPNTTVLATSKSEKSGDEHPVFWTNQYGKGRVFGTTYGHSSDTFSDKVFLEALINGIVWAGGRASAGSAEPAPGQQVEQRFKTSDSAEVPYLLYLPESYKPGAPLPIMLFLHGRGESDGPLSVVAKWGPPLSVSRGEKLPYILLSPQCPKEDNWSSAIQQARLTELLNSIVEKFGADKNHIYLTGLSMGGSGSWRMAADHPELFAAVVPICGRGDLKDADTLKSLPIWVFCGDQDQVFKPNEALVQAIKQAGSQSVHFTSLENIGHNSWSAAYASPDLYQWLGRQSREKK